MLDQGAAAMRYKMAELSAAIAAPFSRPAPSAASAPSLSAVGDGKAAAAVAAAALQASLNEEQRLETSGLLVRPLPYSSGAYANLGISDPLPLEGNMYPTRVEGAACHPLSVLHALVGLAADAASDAKRAEVAARREAQEQAKRGSSKSSNKSKEEKAAAVIEAGERLHVTEQELAQVQSPDLSAGLDACRAAFNPHHVATFKAMSKMVRAALKSARSKAGAAGSVFVDANSSVSYSSALGFRLAVDGLDIFPASSIKYSGIYVLASPLPQGLFYSSSGVLQSDVTYYSHLSYTSKTMNPRLADGYKAYSPATAGGGIGNSSMPLYLILDVRCLATAYTLKSVILGGKCKSLSQPRALALGFSLLPALVMGQRGRRFTASGNYRLPVYQTGGGSWGRDPTRSFDELSWEQLCNVRGGPPTEVLDMLGGGIAAASTVTPTPSATPSGDLPDHPSSLLLEVLQRAEAQGLICRVRGASLVCCLVDGSREGQFEVAFGQESEEPSRVITPCLPPGTSAEYAKAQPPHSKATTISNSIEGLNAGSTDAHREQVFQTFLSISTLAPPTNTPSQL